MILADIDLGSILWSLLVVFFMVIYFMVIFSIFGDLFRSRDMGGLAKALWVLFIFIFFFVGPFVYLIVRGGGMSERNTEARAEAERQVRDHVQAVISEGGTGSPVGDIEKAKALLDSGAITEEEFRTLKARALG